MKECRICKTKQPLDNFHRRGTGHRTECKVCKSKMERKVRRRSDGYYSVYYLPEHHYVGMTNSVRERMMEHWRKNRRITDGYEVLATFERAVDAHLFETQLHAMGYEGFYYKNKNKNK